MNQEEREARRKAVSEAARASIQAREQAEDDIIIAMFDGAFRGSQNIVELLLQNKRAAELSLRNSKIAIQILLAQEGKDMVDWDNLPPKVKDEKV